MDDNQIKHLEMVQGVINRVANNSFLLKGWTITIAAALFALYANSGNRDFLILALFPSLAFWGLDAYYLRLERCFRELHEDICSSPLEKGDGSVACFSMNVKRYEKSVQGWLRTFFAPSVLFVHGVIVFLILWVAFGQDVAFIVAKLIS